MQNSFDAVATAANWLRGAQEQIDTILGEGYAKKNPALIQAFMQAAANAYLARHGS